MADTGYATSIIILNVSKQSNKKAVSDYNIRTKKLHAVYRRHTLHLKMQIN